MPHLRACSTAKAESRSACAPAEIDLLGIHKEARVEGANPLEHLPPDEHPTAADEVDRHDRRKAAGVALTPSDTIGDQRGRDKPIAQIPDPIGSLIFQNKRPNDRVV